MKKIPNALAALAVVAVTVISPAHAKDLPDAIWRLAWSMATIQTQIRYDVPADHTLGTLEGLKKVFSQGGCSAVPNAVARLTQMQNRLYATGRIKSIEDSFYVFFGDVEKQVRENCSCYLTKQWYGISQPPYGGGRYCLTEQEASAFRTRGAMVRPLGTPCYQ